jgi:hypothetical protein
VLLEVELLQDAAVTVEYRPVQRRFHRDQPPFARREQRALYRSRGVKSSARCNGGRYESGGRGSYGRRPLNIMGNGLRLLLVRLRNPAHLQGQEVPAEKNQEGDGYGQDQIFRFHEFFSISSDTG